ncbi:MAG: hypothetical protein KDK39_00140, partial [Leptospiraceae bacterium]|nr:hypothetical protein [Leptospiraceae bacterium]
PPRAHSTDKRSADSAAIWPQKQSRVETARPAQPLESQVNLLQLSGTLLLDHKRHLLARNSHYSNLSMDFFAHLQRIGPANLRFQPNEFQILCENQVFTYPLADLDQIIFQDSGAALVPVSAQLPIAVFLCADAARIKAFVRDRSRQGLEKTQLA